MQPLPLHFGLWLKAGNIDKRLFDSEDILSNSTTTIPKHRSRARTMTQLDSSWNVFYLRSHFSCSQFRFFRNVSNDVCCRRSNQRPNGQKVKSERPNAKLRREYSQRPNRYESCMDVARLKNEKKEPNEERQIKVQVDTQCLGSFLLSHIHKVDCRGTRVFQQCR